MRSERSVWLTPHVHLGVLLFVSFTAALLAWFVELDHPAAKAPVSVEVSGDPDRPSREFFSAVRGFSQEQSVAVAFLTSDIDDMSQRALFLQAPAEDPIGSWLIEGYPSRLGSAGTRVESFSGLSDGSAAGQYLVYGPLEVAERFASLAEQFTYSTSVYRVSPVDMLLLRVHVLFAVVGVTVLGVMVIAAATFSRARHYAVMRFFGNSAMTVFVREFIRVGRYLWPRALALFVVAGSGLVVAKGWAAVVQVAGIAGPLVALTIALMLVVHGLTLVLAYFLPDTLSAIRGRLQHLPLMSLSFSVKLPVVFTLAILSGFLIQSSSSLKNLHDAIGGMAEARGVQRAAVSPKTARNGDEQTAIFLGVGRWLSRLDLAGEAVVAQPMLLDSGQDLKWQQQLLVVNPSYLVRHSVKAADGSRFELPPGGEEDVVIAVPSSLLGDLDRISTEIAGFLENNLKESPTEEPVRSRVSVLADDQTLFAYGADSFESPEPMVGVHQPVLVVVPSGQFDLAFYASMAGTGGFLFTEPEKAIKQATNNSDLSKYIIYIQDPVEPFVARYRVLLGEVAAGLAASLFLLAALIGASFGVSVSYRTQDLQRTTVRRLFGWSLFWTCRRAWFWEVILGLVAIMFFGYQTLQSHNQVAELDWLTQKAQATEGAIQMGSLVIILVVSLVSLSTFLKNACKVAETTRVS